ncbi:MAG: hypothetical protein SH847_04945 [Roseiflexaceae bacterium]|nr:hypothetical protein [Roseiflexaceae bacterium]
MSTRLADRLNAVRQRRFAGRTVELELFVQKVPGAAHRAALEICALVHFTTESLLAAMLDLPNAHELFDWLRSLSFVASTRQGMFPHDLAREALTADVRWRNPQWYAERIDLASRLGRSNQDDAEPRKGVPQGRHIHQILLRGAQVLEQLFPGLEQQMPMARVLLACSCEIETS